MSITLRHAAACYQAPDGEVEAVRDVSFTVEEGAFVSLVGPSGCGKSTLLSAIAGLEPLSGGAIEIDGRTVQGTSPKIGFMPQRDQLFEWRNIWDNVTLGLTVRGEKDPAAYAHVSRLLERYGLASFAKKRPCQLSGGMRQRAALIRTLALEPDLLLLGGQIAKSFSWFGKELERECEKRKIRIQIETETSGRAMEGLLSQFPEKTQ